MTGFGEADRQGNGLAVAVEVRAINSRYFKLSVRSTDGYSSLDPKIEAVVRRQIKRGTVQVGLHVDREPSADDYTINATVLASYRQQLEAQYGELKDSQTVNLESLLVLPGVVDETQVRAADVSEEWPIIEQALLAAMENLSQMRADEGHAMAIDLKGNCDVMANELGQIERRADIVVEDYRGRLTERVNKVLAEFDLAVEPADVVREVTVFAERSDISEEIVRLRSHLDQFDTIMGHPESSGRKLEFLTQEMFRETNTIGSKANDAEIARHVIEVKTAIERMREMIQNVE